MLTSSQYVTVTQHRAMTSSVTISRGIDYSSRVVATVYSDYIITIDIQ